MADAASRPMHWLYDRTKLEDIVGKFAIIQVTCQFTEYWSCDGNGKKFRWPGFLRNINPPANAPYRLIGENMGEIAAIISVVESGGCWYGRDYGHGRKRKRTSLL